MPAGAATLEPVVTRGHPGWRVVIDLPARRASDLVLRMFELSAGDVRRFDMQALARPALVQSRTCG